MRLEFESILPPPVLRETVEPKPPTVVDTTAEAKELLADGIRSARSGDRVKARVSLLRSSELDPKSESTWLWLASISEYPEELLVFLTNVLNLNPENQRAIEWTAGTKSLLSKTFVQRGIDAADERKSDYAVQCFNQALEYDPTNTLAWLWLATLCDSHEGKITYFERVLSIDPSNETAASGLESAQHEMSQRQLTEARAAAVAGRTAEANEFLDAIIAENPDSEDAWILRAHLAEGFDRKILAFERVLHLNPENTTARSGLDSLLSIIETVTPGPEHTPVAEVRPDSSVDEFTRDLSSADSEHLIVPLHCEQPGTATDHLSIEVHEVETECGSDMQSETLGPCDIACSEEYFAVIEPEFLPSSDLGSLSEAEHTYHSSAFFETADEWTPETQDENVAGFEMRLELPETIYEPAAEPEKIESSVEITTEPAFDTFGVEDAAIQTSQEGLQPAYDLPLIEPSAPAHEHAAATVDENVFDSVRELPDVVIEHVAAAPATLSEDSNHSPVVTPCSFCTGKNDVQAIVCHTCNAVLTLSDLEMLIANTGADKLMLRDSVERMEAEKYKRELSQSELTMLGIGHLNLHNHQYGFNYLLQASELDPNNVVLGSQVNALRIRLDEMKRRDEVHEAKPKGKTILIVDDSPTVRKLIAGKLEKCGHGVVCAGDGVEALERLDDLVPDLVLLDINMPRMDGYQVCKIIRNNTATQDVPVIMISGKDGFFDKVRGRMAGTTGYITKPFGPETLMKAVETYLSDEAVGDQVN